MYNALLSAMIRLKHNDEGATLVEYGIALGLAIAVGGTALGLLADDVSGQFGDARTAINPPPA